MTHANGAEVVPFGKYRDRPVTELLADRDYVDWLRSQPWLQQKQPTIYNVIIGAGGNEPQDTPEHNAMQARYIDAQHRTALARPLVRSSTDLLADAARRVELATDAERANLDCTEQKYRVGTSQPEFELRGWDVVFSASAEVSAPAARVLVPWRSAECPWCASTGHIDACEAASRKSDERWQRQAEAAAKYGLPEPPKVGEQKVKDCHICHEYVHSDACPRRNSDDWERLLKPVRSDTVRLHVELKPTIGDDFPAVLRQVSQRRDRDVAGGDWGWGYRAVVVTDRLVPTSVTADQVRQMFTSRTVELLLTSDLHLKELSA